MFQPLTDRDALRERINAHLPFLTHDFIREPAAFFGRARTLEADTRSREINPRDDLRYHAVDDGLDLMICGERLAWDSDFFGVETARLFGVYPADGSDFRLDYSAALRRWLNAIHQRGIRYVLVSAMPEDLALLRGLGTCGFALIASLSYYYVHLPSYDHERYAVRAATADDLPLLTATARDCVNPYDRFHSDPAITPAEADRMMMRWISASVQDGFADVTLVPDHPAPRAFMTVNMHTHYADTWGVKLGQCVLSAVDRSFKGWYLKLMSEAWHYMRESGWDYGYIPTQITNRAAIRPFEKLGLRNGRAEHTFRRLLS